MSQSNYVKKVAIVGATGTVGVLVVDELLKLGKHEITALTRKDSAAASRIPAGVSIAKIDYDDEPTIVDALRGQEVLIITMDARAPEDRQLKLVRAAAAARVPYVLPNEWGCDMAEPALSRDILLGKVELATRSLVEELGVSSWVGVVTGFWYAHSLGFGEVTFGMEWRDRTWTFFDDGEAKINTITWSQTGRAVARLLSLPIESTKDGEASLSDYKNKHIYVSSFLVSQKDMFASVLRVTGTKKSDWKITYEPSSERFAEAQKRLFSGDGTAYVKLLYSRNFFKDGSGNFEARRGLANDILGLPKEDLDEVTKIAVDRNEKGIKYH